MWYLRNIETADPVDECEDRIQNPRVTWQGEDRTDHIGGTWVRSLAIMFHISRVHNVQWLGQQAGSQHLRRLLLWRSASSVLILFWTCPRIRAVNRLGNMCSDIRLENSDLERERLRATLEMERSFLVFVDAM
eukprot:3896211-Rhodomonas_salina.3